MFKLVRRFTWKLYKGFCFFTGTLVLIYPFLLGLMYFSMQFNATFLSNDIYIVKRSIFGDYGDIILRKSSGENIFEGEVREICFNENYIHISTDDSNPSFLYIIQEDKNLYDNDSEYSDILRTSNLNESKRGFCAANRCSGAEDTLFANHTASGEINKCRPVLSK